MKMDKISEAYSGLINKNELLLGSYKKRLFLISMLRLMVFIAGAILSVIAFGFSAFTGSLVILVTLIVFLFLVKLYTRFSFRISFTENLIAINTNELNALGGDYSAFDGGSDHINPEHDFSNDIDLFGESSLFGYLNRTVTGPGRALLAQWIAYPYSLREHIAGRQEAIRELAAKLQWRQTFMALGLDKRLGTEEINSLTGWLNGNEEHLPRFLRLATNILPVSAIVTLLLSVTGILNLNFFIVVFLFNLFLIGMNLKKSNSIHSRVSQKHLFLSSTAQLIRSVEKEEFISPVLTGIQDKICTDRGSVADRIKELESIIKSFDSRLNLFAGLILNGLLLWDFQCILRLEKWRRSVASNLPEWLNLLGEIDGLNSLANYTYNNPLHSFPEINIDGTVIDSYGMGHPLLRRETRTDNDFSVRQRGQVFIITGANMAGKSTFLRSVAVNMVLGMTGAPVCALKMSLSPVKLFTSMRTTDSLSHNESYFYAELKRLKALKERMETGEEIFFVLDEILKGTNSTDKSLGSKLFLRRLIELGGTGLIATHDISLGEMEEEFPEHIVNKCFEIEIDGEKINFDYILRDGITRKMNAAILMRQMGIT